MRRTSPRRPCKSRMPVTARGRKPGFVAGSTWYRPSATSADYPSFSASFPGTSRTSARSRNCSFVSSTSAASASRLPCRTAGTLSEDNLMRFLRGGRNCPTAAKTNVSRVADAVEEALPSLGSRLCRLSDPVRGKTVPVDLELAPTDPRPVWVHVFRDRCRAISEEAELFEDPAAFEENRANRNDDVAPRALVESDTLRWFKKPAGVPGTGLFASVSTMECPTRFVLDTYGQRDSVEKRFTAERRTSTWTYCMLTGRTRRSDPHRFLRGTHASVRTEAPHGGVP